MLTAQDFFAAGYHSILPNSDRSISYPPINNQASLHSLCKYMDNSCDPIDYHCRLDDPTYSSFIFKEIKPRFARRQNRQFDLEETYTKIAYRKGQQKREEKKRFDNAVQEYSQKINYEGENEALVSSSNLLILSKELVQYLGTINPKWKSYEECIKLNSFDVKKDNPYKEIL
jgi:hypothetical protein